MIAPGPVLVTTRCAQQMKGAVLLNSSLSASDVNEAEKQALESLEVRASQDLPQCSDLVRKSWGQMGWCSQPSLGMVFWTGGGGVTLSHPCQGGLPVSWTYWKGIQTGSDRR